MSGANEGNPKSAIKEVTLRRAVQAETHGERRALAAMDDVALRRLRRDLPHALRPAHKGNGRLHWRPQLILARGHKQ
jgi:hypothetical protein